MSKFKEVAIDIERVLEFMREECNDHQSDEVQEAVGRIEAYLATYRGV